jgi:hypothetical protein
MIFRSLYPLLSGAKKRRAGSVRVHLDIYFTPIEAIISRSIRIGRKKFSGYTRYQSTPCEEKPNKGFIDRRSDRGREFMIWKQKGV